MDKEILLVFSFVVMVALVGFVIHEAYPDDSNAITGDFKKPKWVKKVQKEASRVEARVEKEAARVGERVNAEGQRFGHRVDAEAQRFDERVSNEVERFGGRVDDEFNRIDDNIKKLGDKAQEEYKRVLRQLRSEIDAQVETMRNLAQGRVCDAYQSARQSKVASEQIDKFVSQELLPPIKNALRPQVASIVATIAAPINSIPVLGQVIYAAVVPLATEWGTDYAAKRAIKEALNNCN